MAPTFGFRRAPWREALRPAGGLEEIAARLCGPRGLVAERVRMAATPWQRTRGLLGRPPPEPGSALLLTPCVQVHTIGLRYPIDVLFCDRDLVVLAVQTLRPGRLSRLVRGAACAIELPAGAAEAAGIEPGVRLALERLGA